MTEAGTDDAAFAANEIPACLFALVIIAVWGTVEVIRAVTELMVDEVLAI